MDLLPEARQSKGKFYKFFHRSSVIVAAMNTGAGAELFIDSMSVGIVWNMTKQTEGLLIEVDGGIAAFTRATEGPHEFKLKLPIKGAPVYKKSMLLLNCHFTKKLNEQATVLLYLVPL